MGKYYLDIRDCNTITFSILRANCWGALKGVIVRDKDIYNSRVKEIIDNIKVSDKYLICEITTKEEQELDDISKHLFQNSNQLRILVNQSKYRTNISLKKLRKYVVQYQGEVIFSDEVKSTTYEEYIQSIKSLDWLKLHAALPKPFLELKKGKPIIIKSPVKYITIPDITKDRFMIFSIASKYKSELVKIKAKGHKPNIIFKLNNNMLSENEHSKLFNMFITITNY